MTRNADKTSARNLCTGAILAITLALIPLPQIAAAAPHYVLNRDAWAQPRTGHHVAQIPVLKKLLQDWMLSPGSTISIYYPGGEAGNLWALELRDWLVSLGIPLAAIRIDSGSPNGDELTLGLQAR